MITSLYVHQIKPNPLNELIYGEIKPDLTMTESIKRNGLLEPVVVSSDFIIISGHRRYSTLKSLGKEKINVRIIDKEAKYLSEELIEFNRQRIKTSRQRVSEIRYLKNILGRKSGHRSDLRSTSVKIDAGSKRRTDTRTQISKALGISTGNISKLLYIDEHHPELLQWIDDGSASLHQVYHEAKKRNEKREKNIFIATDSSPISVRDSERWSIITGDTRTIKIPTKKIQTCITSAPYFNLRDYKRDDQIGLESSDFEFLNSLYLSFDNVRNHMTSNGSLFVELGEHAPDDKYSGLLERFCLGMMERGWILRERIPVIRDSWATNRLKSWVPCWSMLFFFSVGEEYVFNRDAIRRPYNGKQLPKAGVYRRRLHTKGEVGTPYFPHPEGKVGRNILAVHNDKWINDFEKRHGYRVSHPAPFPKSLVTEPIAATTKKGDLVCDCFSGTGTTGVAALELGRNYLGIELNDSYSEISKIRLNDTLMDLKQS